MSYMIYSNIDDSRNRYGGEQEIDSRTIQIENKRFYIDIKENARGRFMKITEVSPDGIKQRIVMTLDVGLSLRDILADFVQSSRSLPTSRASNGQDGCQVTLKSEMITRDVRRRYYVDLKENRRGRFVRVSQVSTSTNQREQIAVPAPDGIAQMHTALDELLRSLGATQPPIHLPEASSLHLDRGKTIYFDVGSNEREVFLTLSEVRNNSRSSIVLPQRCWRQFRDALDSYIAQCPPADGSNSSAPPTAAAASPAPAPASAARPTGATASSSSSTGAAAAAPGPASAAAASRATQHSTEASSRTTSAPDSPTRAATASPDASSESASASASASATRSATASPDEGDSRFSDARDN